jgi:hypothetical protein
MLLLGWCPFKIRKEKLAGLHFTSTDYLSLVLTPPRIRWTIPLNLCFQGLSKPFRCEIGVVFYKRCLKDHN